MSNLYKSLIKHNDFYKIIQMETEEVLWLAKVFRKIELFSTLTMADLESLIAGMEKYHFAKGEKIIKQGESGDAFFIIYKGKVKVTRKKSLFSSVELGELGPESFFGEMALLTNEPRVATVIATEETDCFVLFRGQFQNLVEKNPTFQKLVKNLQEKRSFELQRK